MPFSCKRAARVVMLALQCSPRTSQRASSVQPACLGTGAAECGGILGSNFKVWDLNPTSEVWDSGVVLLRWGPLYAVEEIVEERELNLLFSDRWKPLYAVEEIVEERELNLLFSDRFYFNLILSTIAVYS